MFFNKGTYEEDTQEFIEITAEEFEEKLAAGEKAIVYLGKAACPYCRKFVPKLDNVRKEKKLTIHYLDSQNTPTDPAIQSLRDRMGVRTLPALVTIDGPGQFTNLNADSSLSEEEITAILDKKS
ncbi:MAG: conjugal transfer protein TraF [Trichococcus flocculiformis]